MKNDKKGRRLISLMTTLVMAASFVPYSSVSAEDADEWAYVQEIVGQYAGRWSAPPTNVVTGNMTSGPILGNGDLGVVMGGDQNMQTYYISKSDFWALTKEDNSDGTPKAIGGLNIKNSSPSGAESNYSAEQDILNAEISSDLPFGGAPVRTRAWVSADSNELIVEITPVNSKQPVNVTAQLWSKSDNNENGYVTSAGAEEETVWVTRQTPERAKGSCYAAVAGRVLGGENVTTSTDLSSIAEISFTIPAGENVAIVTSIDGGKEAVDCADKAKSRIEELDKAAVEGLYNAKQEWWKDYWTKEYVVLGDRTLEEYYYGSLYQMGAASRAGKVAPGLFGHWTTTDSPAWGGDYTLDYNYYGPFNGMASSNRLEQLGSYFQPVLDFMDEGKKRAKAVKSVHGKSYPDGLPGVKYPTHIGPWGMETYFDCGMKSHAAFASLPFIWYYNYSQDTDFLRDTAYPYLIEVVNFWDEFLQKDNSGRYVVYDSSARESWSGSNDINPVIDLAFVRTLYKNIIPMSETLDIDADRREKWQDILNNLSPLPTMEFNGKTVFREAENRQEISTYGLGDNPVNMQGIFPGDNVGLGSDEELLKTALNSLDIMNSWNQGNAFANIFVMGARVGWPAQDLMNKMKSRISSIKQPNLTYQSDGHGLEGAGVIEAINSMLMQSHEGVLRFFPVWPQAKDAEFAHMRAAGAFLVSAKHESGVVQPVTVYSEKGKICTVENPWKERTLIVTVDGNEVETVCEGNMYTFATDADKTYTLSPKEGLPDPVPPETEKPLPEETISPMPVPDKGYWKLDDTGDIAKDSSQAENDGTIYGASPVEGKLSGAMNFDGQDDYILISDYEKPSSFATYSAWVKADSLTNWGTILKNWGESTAGQIQLGLESNSGKLSVHIMQSNGNEVSCSEASAFPTGIWQHVAVTADGSRIRLYRNGVETASTGYNGSLKTSFAPLGIGTKPNDAGTRAAAAGASPGWWNGDIDDVRIYSKALSTEEIGLLASFERYRDVFSEDFESPSVLNTIEGGRNGWSLGGSNEERVVQIGDNLGIASNAVRFGAGNTWGQTMWMSLDLQENMLSKLLEDGIDYDIAAENVAQKLSGDMRVSFKAYFNCGDEDGRGASYVLKLKDSDYVPFMTIKVTPNRTDENVTLSLIALNADKTENKEYVIFRGKSNVMDRVMNFNIDINTADNTYKLNINGQDIKTDNGVWNPASDSENVGVAKPHNLGDITAKQIDFVVNNSGWWQAVTIDNIKVSHQDNSREIDAAITETTKNDDSCRISASFANVSKKDLTFTAIYALYDEDGVLVGADVKDIQLGLSGAAAQTVDIPCSAPPVTAKIFMWDSMADMCPLPQDYLCEKIN